MHVGVARAIEKQHGMRIDCARQPTRVHTCKEAKPAMNTSVVARAGSRKGHVNPLVSFICSSSAFSSQSSQPVIHGYSGASMARHRYCCMYALLHASELGEPA